MASQANGRRRVRRPSFTSQFALVLLGVGLATALAAGAVAWLQTGQAGSQQSLQAASGDSRLGLGLVTLETATASEQLACEVAALPATAQGLAAGSATLQQALQAAEPSLGAGRRVLVEDSQGRLLAEVPSGGAPLAAGAARRASGCAPGNSSGYFVASGGGLSGMGAALIPGGSGAVVLVETPLSPAVLTFAQRLVASRGAGAHLALVAGTRLAAPVRLGDRTLPAGSAPPRSLGPALHSPRASRVNFNGASYAVVGLPLRAAGGAVVGRLLLVESTLRVGPTFGQLALPLALAVAGVLLLGMVVVFLLVEHFLNRPLRRLDLAVQRLAQDAYATPVTVEGAEEVSRLGANFEIMRRRLRRQLLIATGRSVIASTLTGNAPLEHTLTQVLRSLTDLLEADLAIILVRAQPQLPRGLLIALGAAEPLPSWSELEGSQGLLGRLIREPRFLVRTHLAEDERGPVESHFQLQNCLVEPLRSEDRDLGLLLLGNRRSPYLEDDNALCDAVAGQIVVAVEKNLRLAATQREATTDAMTGLYNYRFLVGYLDQQVNVAERASANLSVLMLDLDHFKAVNDTYGHPAGDRVLRQFATLMLDTIRRSDLAARYGGEEFVVVMANTGRDDAELVAEKIRAAVGETEVRLEDGHAVRVTVSVGGVTFPEGSRGERNLLDLADRALYSAKRGGRDRVEFLDLAGVADTVPAEQERG
ncbi:MAG: diguanylate cyclase [Candidatus Dormibacteria bacterium]